MIRQELMSFGVEVGDKSQRYWSSRVLSLGRERNEIARYKACLDPLQNGVSGLTMI